jgi:histidinol dehydrogenase
MVGPIDAAAIYVPGGTAAYPSSQLMSIIPAQVAGVPRIVMATPSDAEGKIYPVTLAAAVEAGVTDIYKMGGAQAVAALAFGTESVPRVDKITGPGNIYVAMAKRAVFGYVGIDSIAGPSDITVVADETANPAYVAADMLSQAEHDERAQSILVTTSMVLAEEVREEISKQAASLNRKEIISASLKNKGLIFLVDSISDAFCLVNAIAPEHLEICTKEPFDKLTLLRNAGAVFLGNYTPEPLGDYMAGPSHVLPTEGTARFFSPLSVDDFVKKTSVLSFSKTAFARLSKDVAKFAYAEGFDAHAKAVEIRETSE